MHTCIYIHKNTANDILATVHSNLEFLEPGLGKRINGEYVLYPVVVMFKLRIFLYLLGHTVDRENTYTIITQCSIRLYMMSP